MLFTEPVVSSSPRVTLHRAAGRKVATAPPQLTGDGAGVRVLVPELSTGIYVVSWSVVADDGHESAGEFAFAVGPVHGTVPAARTRRTSIPVGDSAATALFLGGLALALGGLFSERFVWRPENHDGQPVPRAPVTLALVVVCAAGVIQLAILAGNEPIGIAGTRSWSDALGTRPGLLTAFEVLAVMYALWILLVVPRLRSAALVPLAGAAVAAALRGHAGVSGTWWAGPANVLHLVLGTLWVGALVHLVLVLRRADSANRRSLLTGATQRYASMALVAVPPLLLLGVVTALAEIDQLKDLVSTTYGRVLLIKLGLVAAALTFAIAARLRALNADGSRLGALRRLARPEAITLLAVVAASAVLASTAPPFRGAARADLLGPPPLTGPVARSADLAGQLAVFLAATDDGLRLELIAPGGEPPTGATVAIDGTRPDSSTFTLFPRGCGRGCFTVPTPWEAGTTKIDLGSSARHWTSGYVSLDVAWPPGGDASTALAQIVAAMRNQPAVEITEAVSSGPGSNARPGAVTLSGA